MQSRIQYSHASPSTYSALQLAGMYGFPIPGPTPSMVAIISLGGGWAMSDVQAYCTKFNLPVPNILPISIDGAKNAYSGDPNSADGENALDIQNVIGATHGKINIRVYHCQNTGASFAKGVAQVAKDSGVFPIAACSISWGSMETSWSETERQEMDAAILSCLAVNIPVFCASGDDGSTDGGNGNNVDYPASSPYAVGCGGTTISASGEKAWSYGGGGISELYDITAWQKETLSGNKRGVPDMSANADPNTGYPIVIRNKWLVLGGTSAVGPMLAAGVACVMSNTGSRLKDFGKIIYTSNMLTDVTTGSNGAYAARMGYDCCTGEGIPSIKFWQLFGAVSPPPPVQPPPVQPPQNTTTIEIDGTVTQIKVNGKQV